jgi:hypothetical protein
MAKASSRRMQRGVEKEEDLLGAQEVPPWHGGQCPHGHDGTKPGEGTNDTSARHHTHQHQISPRGRPSNSRRSSRSPWPRSKAQEATEPRAQGGCNRPNLLDRQECRCEIYRLWPISAANSGGGGQNRARWQWGDAVARARARGRREVNATSARSVWPSHLVGFDQAGRFRQEGHAR